MRLRFREKQSLYHSLGQLLRAGVTFPAALRSLAPSARGGLRRFLSALISSLESGHSVAEAFASQQPIVTVMESSIVAAVERAGRLDQGLTQLSTYFGALDAAKNAVKKRIAYPLFLLHFGILTLGIKTLLTQGAAAYAYEVGATLGLLYACGLVVFLGIVLLHEAGTTSPGVDAALRFVPIAGSIRSNFAVSRFCATYEMQLAAGINVMDALRNAGRAAQSGMIARAIAHALPQVLQGAQVGPLLSVGNAFPDTMLRDFSVGEQTGKLDEELARLSAEHQAKAISALDTLADWGPKLGYAAICIYVGYRIVSFYLDYFKAVKDITDQIH